MKEMVVGTFEVVQVCNQNYDCLPIVFRHGNIVQNLDALLHYWAAGSNFFIRLNRPSFQAVTEWLILGLLAALAVSVLIYFGQKLDKSERTKAQQLDSSGRKVRGGGNRGGLGMAGVGCGCGPGCH